MTGGSCDAELSNKNVTQSSPPFIRPPLLSHNAGLSNKNVTHRVVPLA